MERLDLDRYDLEMGGLLAARRGSGAFACALMAHSGMEKMIPDVPASYAAAARSLRRIRDTLSIPLLR